jgi:NAD(P)-dependent dehydrogenase (short-subunit alcohol dehydrogenase family)
MTERFALITGGNRGLGLETARQLTHLAKGRYRVLLCGRDATSGERAARELGAAFHPLDVSDGKSIAALAEHLRSLPPLDALVNNAGISMKGFDQKVARGTIDTNFLGPVHLTDALLDRLAPSSNVVMVSSGMGELACLSPPLRARLGAPLPTRDEVLSLVEKFVADVAQGVHGREGWPTSAYSVSKVALNAWTRILAHELAPRGIRVNAVNPGWVRTDMGGSSAPRSVQEGARGIVWAATLQGEGPSGGFFCDGKPNDW